jgi:hypothetical protein
MRESAGRRVVRAVEHARNDLGQIVPEDAEIRVIHEIGVAGGGAAFLW